MKKILQEYQKQFANARQTVIFFRHFGLVGGYHYRRCFSVKFTYHLSWVGDIHHAHIGSADRRRKTSPT